MARLRRWGAPSYLGTALCRLGQLRGDDGLADMREAVEVLTPTYAAVELARARCMLGRRADVPDDEAVELLRAALLSTSSNDGATISARDRPSTHARTRDGP